ncbi:ABC transporter ATP-binding protein [Anaerovorax odorimutans]|uniref:ABC transporter ATP-binding protein n=1 Tax=Anaerovorax odorimutans TaxID=109327 RepID=UPI000419C750|nr:ABC transporter ATP-binding protein [Anaerovorax odorimutans]
MKNKISIHNLSFSYNGKGNQLKNINLNIHSGEVIVLTGSSGSGKSSLTKVINGLIPYFFEGELNGKIFINNKPLNDVPSWQRGKIIGNVFQDPRSQFFANEVAGEIAFACENYGYSHHEICEHVNSSAREMKIEKLLNNSIHSLSYGMRQKVAIASAKAIDPEIYVMDEPSANLDISSTYILGNIIKDLKSQGKTIIIAEHRLYYLMDIADRFLLIQNGRIIHEFSEKQMINLNNKDIYSFGLRSPDLYQIQYKERNSISFDNIALKVRNLCKTFKNMYALNNLNFICRTGEVIAIIGPNGSGKSTLGRILAGLLKENSGEIFLFDYKSKRKDRLSKVWYIPQDLDSQLFGENLLDELITGSAKTEERIKRAEQILSELELTAFEKQHPSTLSGGQKQRLALGVALMHDAPIIILDEPTSGLDGKNMRNVSNLIRKLANIGHTILVITHDAECALACCERAIRLENGNITDNFKITSSNLLLEKIGY